MNCMRMPSGQAASHSPCRFGAGRTLRVHLRDLLARSARSGSAAGRLRGLQQGDEEHGRGVGAGGDAGAAADAAARPSRHVLLRIGIALRRSRPRPAAIVVEAPPRSTTRLMTGERPGAQGLDRPRVAVGEAPHVDWHPVLWARPLITTPQAADPQRQSWSKATGSSPLPTDRSLST